jgi:4-amino-4-deoxy-L-arabinose transferase-like glycosyltransferase
MAVEAEPTPFPAIEAWLQQRSRRVMLSLAAAAVFVRLIFCLQLAGGPLPDVQQLLVDSDMTFFDAWGRHLAAGDWLQREPFHPMPAWMRRFADEVMKADPAFPVRVGLAANEQYDHDAMRSALWTHWLGGPVWFQEPGYAWLVGLTYLLSGPSPWHVFFWQLALGVVAVVLVHRIAARLFSSTAALAAGVLAVGAPIPLAYEATLLRDQLVVVVTLVLVYLMSVSTEGGRARALVLGVAFGAASLVKQPFLAFPILMGGFRWFVARTPLRERLSWAGLVAAGIALALLPAIVRNLVVGAAPLAFNGSAAAQLALYHTARATPFELTLTPEFTRVLLIADGRPLASFIEAVKTHASVGSWLWLETLKVAYGFHGFESANDVDFYLFRQGAPVLAWLPVTIVVLVPLAAVGGFAQRLKAWPLWVAIAGSLPTLALAAAVSRYKAPIVAALFPLAGAGVVALVAWGVRRKWQPVAAWAALSLGYVLWATHDPPGKEAATRATGYAQSGVYWLDFGAPAYAALELKEALRLAPDSATVEHRLGQALYAAGEAGEALPHVEAAARQIDTPELRELHACVLAELGRRDEALALARSALTQDPNRTAARLLLEKLAPQ